jgi:hypothetical protein
MQTWMVQVELPEPMGHWICPGRSDVAVQESWPAFEPVTLQVPLNESPAPESVPRQAVPAVVIKTASEHEPTRAAGCGTPGAVPPAHPSSANRELGGNAQFCAPPSADPASGCPASAVPPSSPAAVSPGTPRAGSVEA